MTWWLLLGILLVLMYKSGHKIGAEVKRRDQEEEERKARVRALYPSPPSEEEAEDAER